MDAQGQTFLFNPCARNWLQDGLQLASDLPEERLRRSGDRIDITELWTLKLQAVVADIVETSNPYHPLQTG
jgi:hypothetical protein